MNITAEAGLLSAALSLASAGLRAKGKVVPPVRLDATGGAVTVTCTDPNVAITSTAAANIITPGKAAVDAGKLSLLVAGFPNTAEVSIATTETGLTVRCGSSRSRLATVPIESLPAPLALDLEIGAVEISSSDFLRLLWPLFAASGEQTRQYLCGIFLHDVADHLVGIATDGMVLSRAAIRAGTFATDRTLIVPTASAATLQRIIGKTKSGTVTLSRSPRLFCVTAPAFTFVSRLVDAGASGFVIYERVVPPPAAAIVTVNRSDLASALSRIAAVARVDAALVAFSWDLGEPLTVFLAREPKTGADTIAATGTGHRQIAIGLSQAISLLAEFSGETIDLETDDGPLVFRGDGKMALITRSAWRFQFDAEDAAA